MQRIRKNRSIQKKKAKSSRSETVNSPNNNESIRRRNGKAVRSLEAHGGGSAGISHRNDSSSEDKRKKGADTSKYSTLSLDWKDYCDPDERDK